MEKARAIAVVLPQFHRIPENDKWWGRGFTEWTNVTKAKPLYKGHYQPHLPADLGFYDLRLAEARDEQAALAKEHGIFGFCYYHYWFNGKRLLKKPVDEILRTQKPEMPFMLCWANEEWTRRWEGKDKEILMDQVYSEKDNEDHMEWLCQKVFPDNRYIKIDGCPVFIVYRPADLPYVKNTSKVWRSIAKRNGFKDIYLCYFESLGNKVNPDLIGFDAAIEFSPQVLWSNTIPESRFKSLFNRFLKRKGGKLNLTDYSKSLLQSLRYRPNYKYYRSVTPSWDNTSRKGMRGTVSIGSSPEKYQKWLEGQIENFHPYSKEENLIFINAMNEWAEGNHLEPCRKYGKAYLEATKKGLRSQVLKNSEKA